MSGVGSEVASSATRDLRSNCFDFIRLIAAVSVVVAHGVRHLDAPFLGIAPGADVLHGGKEGVRVFFILSGMLVFMSALRCLELGRPLRSFFANRFLRVAPAIYAYAIVVSLVLLLIGAISARSLISKTYLAWLFGNCALYPLYFPPEHRSIGVGVLNGSLWTIPVEVMFYLVVPGLAWLWWKGRRHAVAWILGASALVATIVLDQVQRAHPAWFGNGGEDEALWFKIYFAALPPWLYWFALGIAWFYLWERAPKAIGWFVASCAAYVGLAFVWYDALAPLGAFREIAYGIPLSYATVWFGFKGPVIFRDLSKVGDLSYGVYIWHMVVVNLMLYAGLERSWPMAALVPFAIAGTLAMAWLSWWLVERPALRRKPYSVRAPKSESPPP